MYQSLAKFLNLKKLVIICCSGGFMYAQADHINIAFSLIDCYVSHLLEYLKKNLGDLPLRSCAILLMSPCISKTRRRYLPLIPTISTKLQNKIVPVLSSLVLPVVTTYWRLRRSISHKNFGMKKVATVSIAEKTEERMDSAATFTAYQFAMVSVYNRNYETVEAAVEHYDAERQHDAWQEHIISLSKFIPIQQLSDAQCIMGPEPFARLPLDEIRRQIGPDLEVHETKDVHTCWGRKGSSGCLPRPARGMFFLASAMFVELTCPGFIGLSRLAIHLGDSNTIVLLEYGI
jgi:hypothetical protein